MEPLRSPHLHSQVPSFLLRAFLLSCMFKPALRSFVSAPALFQRKKERKKGFERAKGRIKGSWLEMKRMDPICVSLSVRTPTLVSSIKGPCYHQATSVSCGYQGSNLLCLTSLLESENRAEVYHQT